MNLNFASVWEMIADLVPDNDALICGEDVVSWKSYDSRSSKVASALINAGLGANAKAGLYLNNSNEYLIGQNAIFKIGGVPINVNYRYVEEELIYLLDNSDAEAVFYHACYSSRIKQIAKSLPNIKAWIEVADGNKSHFSDCIRYEEILNDYPPMERIERDPETIYMLYTGGTTGMPKGVMYKQGEFLTFLFRTLKAMGYDVPEDLSDLEASILASKTNDEFIKSLVGCPLMHGTGMWLGAFLPLLLGGTVITTSNLGFDPDKLWAQVQDKKATNIVIVGTLLSSLIIIIFYKFNKNVQKSELGNLTLSITISRNIVKKDVDVLIKLISKYSKYLEVNSVNHSKNQFVINLFFLPLDFSKNTLLNDQILNKFPDANIIISKDHAISL